MGRKPSLKPWFHSPSGCWCATVKGKRKYLDKDEEVAGRKLQAIRKKARQEKKAKDRDWLDATFAALADEYMADIEARREKNTYNSYRARLLRALRILGTTLRVGQIKKLHLAKIEQAMRKEEYSPTTIKDTLAAVQGVFNWAVEHDLLDSTSLAKYRKPRARRRTRIITPEEYELLLAKADPNFRRVITALRLTGCRPAEVRKLIWSWVDLDRRVWILPKHKTETQQEDPMPRIIPLPDAVIEICRELAQQPHEPSDFVFLNRKSKPYTKNCFTLKWARLRKRAGIEEKSGERVVLYSNRHTYGTEKSANVSAIELAELMGHTDVRTTQRYTHFDLNRLHDIQRRAQGQDPKAPGSAGG